MQYVPVAHFARTGIRYVVFPFVLSERNSEQQTRHCHLCLVASITISRKDVEFNLLFGQHYYVRVHTQYSRQTVQ